MEKLTQEQIESRLSHLDGWSLLNDSISRTYQFGDFLEAMRFVNRVAEAAETAQHHPDILIRWNKVTLTFSTHDAGGITNKDFEMATQTDRLATETE